MNYLGTSVFLVIYSCIIPESFEHVKTVWYVKVHFKLTNGYSILSIPEIREYNNKNNSHAAIVLCASQTDLRSDPATLKTLKQEGKSPITTEQGVTMARHHQCFSFIESSALTGESLNETFNLLLATSVLTTYNVPAWMWHDGKNPNSDKCVVQ